MPSSIVNEKPRFVMGGNAIWHVAESGYWAIGLVSDLGNAISDLYTDNKYGGLTNVKNEWTYWDDGWKTAGPNDVIIQCLLDSKFLPLFRMG